MDIFIKYRIFQVLSDVCYFLNNQEIFNINVSLVFTDVEKNYTIYRLLLDKKEASTFVITIVCALSTPNKRHLQRYEFSHKCSTIFYVNVKNEGE